MFNFINSNNTEQYLIVMVGIPGSGKSTIAKQLAAVLGDDCKIFSSDEYRKNILGKEEDQTQNDKIFRMLYNDLRNYLSIGKSAIIDATNINMKARSRIFHEVNKIKSELKFKIVAYIVNVPITVCIERDSQRKRSVGEDVIMKMVRRFQCPQYFEGFDLIKFDFDVSEDTAVGKKENQDILSLMDSYDQENPHHIFTLGGHCRALASNYEKGSWLYYAGLYHDVGKLTTRNVDEQGIAHYYDHDCVGAYNCCCFPELFKSNSHYLFLNMIMVINYHMKFHKDWRTEKYRKLFGDTLYNILIDFAENDKKASGTESIHQELHKMIKEDKMCLEDIRQSNVYLQCLRLNLTIS